MILAPLQLAEKLLLMSLKCLLFMNFFLIDMEFSGALLLLSADAD